MNDNHKCAYPGCVLPGAVSHDVGGKDKRFVCRFHFHAGDAAHHDAIADRIAATVTGNEKIRDVYGYDVAAQRLAHYIHTGDWIEPDKFGTLAENYRSDMTERAAKGDRHAEKWCGF